MDYSQFFGRKANAVAEDLIGRFLIRIEDKKGIIGKILETGAYEYGNETESRKGMKYSPGKIFLMSYRGKNLFNISTDKEGIPSCVEIRTIIADNKTIKGSGKIADYFFITKDLDGTVIDNYLHIFGDKTEKKIKKSKGQSDNCVGIYSFRRR